MLTDNKALFNAAGTTGLFLGLVSIFYVMASGILGRFEPSGKGVAALIPAVGLLLWAAKFILSIILMRNGMRTFSAEHKEADRRDVLKFGRMAALLSALMYSAYYLANILYISPDVFQLTLDASREELSSMLSASQLEQFDSISGEIPKISFFVNLAYCFVYGWILSLILSHDISPFGPDGTGEEEQ